jgi:environmental stress-induced protein Ves
VTVSAQVLRAADRVARCWGAGSGTTATVAEGDGWRVSIATVTRSGPFTALPGVHRRLALLRGEPLELDLGAIVLRADADAPPAGFAGDEPPTARVTGAGSTVVNAFVSSTGTAKIELVRVDDETLRIGHGWDAVVFAASVTTTVEAHAPARGLDVRVLTLDPTDALVLRADGPAPTVSLRVVGSGRVAVVRTGDQVGDASGSSFGIPMSRRPRR